jgi:hypothetical protein
LTHMSEREKERESESVLWISVFRLLPPHAHACILSQSAMQQQSKLERSSNKMQIRFPNLGGRERKQQQTNGNE